MWSIRSKGGKLSPYILIPFSLALAGYNPYSKDILSLSGHRGCLEMSLFIHNYIFPAG